MYLFLLHIKNYYPLYVINKIFFLKLNTVKYFVLLKICFFSCIYIKVNYYWVFCIIKKYISGYNIRMLEITIGNCYKCDLD